MGIAGQIRSGGGSPTVHIGPTAFLGLGVVDNNGNGARVQRVVGSAPAASVGISTGDVITAVDGVPINSATAMSDADHASSRGHHRGDLAVEVGRLAHRERDAGGGTPGLTARG